MPKESKFLGNCVSQRRFEEILGYLERKSKFSIVGILGRKATLIQSNTHLLL